MPFNELQRQNSWPPTVVRIHADTERDEHSEIDDDPFSFFLTSPEDIDLDFDDEDLSAGIETSAKPIQVREISPSHIQKHSPPLPKVEDEDENENEDDDFGLAMPLSLKDFSRRHTNANDGRKSRAGQRDSAEDKLTGLGIQIPEFAARRGRPVVRLTPMRGGRGRGQTRSLSARRPRSWRAPSPDLGSITEERESDEDVKKGEGEMEISVSAPATSYMEQVPVQVQVEKKKKKRVHWAF